MGEPNSRGVHGAAGDSSGFAVDVFPVKDGAPRFGRVFSSRSNLSIPLPDPDGWQVRRERGSSFVVLEHAASASRLVLRVWREPARMNRKRCEESVSLVRDVPSAANLSTGVVPAPIGFDTHVRIGFAAAGSEGSIRGHVVAFGSRFDRCFAYVFTTTATGAAAQRIVGDRLAVMEGRSLAKVELRSDTELTLPR